MSHKLRCNHRWSYTQNYPKQQSWRVCKGCGVLMGKKMESGRRWQRVEYNPEDLIVKQRPT